jgi:hypothetical protein
LPTDCIKDLVVHIDLNFIFIIMLNFLSTHAMKLLRLIVILTFSYCTIDIQLMLYYILVRSELEYASVAWNSVAVTAADKPGAYK